MANENNTVKIDVGGNGRIGPDKSSQPKTNYASSQTKEGYDLRTGKPARGLKAKSNKK
jgi:hypothetical protein